MNNEMKPISPKIEDFGFLTGTWECSVWEGIFEEVWNTPRGNSITNMGRHFKDGKMTFMEFVSIEQDANGGWGMHMIFGQLQKGEKKPTSFKLDSFKENEVVFVNLKNDFPTHIKYWKPAENKLNCLISGRADGKEEKTLFEFKK